MTEARVLAATFVGILEAHRAPLDQALVVPAVALDTLSLDDQARVREHYNRFFDALSGALLGSWFTDRHGRRPVELHLRPQHVRGFGAQYRVYEDLEGVEFWTYFGGQVVACSRWIHTALTPVRESFLVQDLVRADECCCCISSAGETLVPALQRYSSLAAVRVVDLPTFDASFRQMVGLLGNSLQLWAGDQASAP